MAATAKKVDKKFVLSDSTVNCYGFRLLTSGYQLADYARNPIGYYMHDRQAGVVVRWDELRVEGDQVMGSPIINLSNERGEQTLHEVEAGFLNAASVGDIVVLEYSMEPEMMLPGQTGPTITKWTNKEVSLVDVPGNNNALTRLYDNQDNPINIADLPGLTHIPQFSIKHTDMKKIQLPITAALLANLSFDAKAEPKEDEVVSAIENLANEAAKVPDLNTEVNNLKKEKTKLEDQIKDLKAAGVKAEVDGILAKGLADRKLTNELKATLAVDYATNPTALQKLVAALPKLQSVTDLIAEKGKEGAEDLAGKTWDELHKAGKLADLKKNDPEAFKALYRKEHGTDPKGM